MNPLKDKKLAEQLILDELFDLTLYQRLLPKSKGRIKALLEELIPIEKEHVDFWQDVFGVEIGCLNSARRVKLSIMVFLCRIFGDTGTQLVLEGIEIYGVRKYMELWEVHKNTAFGKKVKRVLEDELSHEADIVHVHEEAQVNPEKVRNIFLGLNDGLVEILGAVGGFFAAFQDIQTVLIASLTTAIAGSLSMAVGAYVAISSEHEVSKVERAKDLFMKNKQVTSMPRESAISSSLFVGLSYLLGAMVTVVPVLFGAQSVFWPFIFASVVIVVVSFILAFLSGMKTRKRIIMNFLLMAGAVVITSSIGLTAKQFFGIDI